LKVLDLTEHMAGPFCTMILADTGGAEVVKLERPRQGGFAAQLGRRQRAQPLFPRH
jgi:crotonobetainyl-CoA:carnitine CoA-transferase CaiB-like acyl-CoA transferase